MSPQPPRPLAGVRVLDLSRVLAGPWAGQMLADYGADVIKIERTGVGDTARNLGWRDPVDGETFFFKGANRNKRCIELDRVALQQLAPGHQGAWRGHRAAALALLGRAAEAEAIQRAKDNRLI